MAGEVSHNKGQREKDSRRWKHAVLTECQMSCLKRPGLEHVQQTCRPIPRSMMRLNASRSLTHLELLKALPEAFYCQASLGNITAFLLGSIS